MAKSITITFTDDEYQLIQLAADEAMTTEISYIVGAALHAAMFVRLTA